jgi:hypothetical protein
MRERPSVKVDVSFSYRPVAPFGVACYPNTYADDLAGLDEAVELFARHAMPRNDRVPGANVFDANGVIVLGYVEVEPERWFGVAAAFEALARFDYLDALEVTCAEITARRHAAP